MTTGYEVDPEALLAAARLIGATVGAVDPAALSGVALGEEAAGHPGVSAAVAEFCATWGEAAKVLAQRATSAGETLTGAASVYETTDGDVRHSVLLLGA
ncbi:hypothetical protein [Amycolatopsis suaedae]|uniref:ESX-1 secretion-associated protein n=1 Tax=Amycolatopsis suaedae TaxID=2510978 RepID=A0A4Q7JBW9_9PSEU|nr:hypothetical protein [Amycolatopsis suaedae]RZQ64502.1 hypothetical protein EWH70_06165 [Amycolatopsis suaedae]